MDITALLNSGELHRTARQSRPDCVDRAGNIHTTPERARFASWRIRMVELYGEDVATWPAIARAEYEARYVPSH